MPEGDFRKYDKLFTFGYLEIRANPRPKHQDNICQSQYLSIFPINAGFFVFKYLSSDVVLRRFCYIGR